REGRPAARTPSTIELGQGVIGQAVLRCKPVVVDDYESWEHALPQVAAAGVRASASVPVMVSDRVLGGLMVGAYSRRHFSAAQIEVLALLAAQVGPAIEAAHLVAEAERRRQEAESLAEELSTLYDAVGCGILVRDENGLI